MKTFSLASFALIFWVVPSLYAQNVTITQVTPKLTCLENVSGGDYNAVVQLTQIGEKGYGLLMDFANGQIPLESDPTTTARNGDLDKLRARAALFEKTKGHIELRFAPGDCKFESQNGEILWNCYLRQPGRVGDLEYKNLAFFVYSQTVQSFWTQYKVYNVGLEFGVEKNEALIRNYAFTIGFENSSDTPSCLLSK